MKKVAIIFALMTLPATLGLCTGQPPLKLVRSISLPGVRGHFDHLAVDTHGHRLFLAAENQPAVEVMDLRTGKQLAEIRGVGKPHSIFFIPSSDELYVTDGRAGACKVFDGRTYKLIQTIKLEVDADSGYYDAASHRIYVVNGGADAHEPYSLVSVINTQSRADVRNIKVPNNDLEALRLGGSTQRLYVNLNGSNQVGVINLKNGQLIARWGLNGAEDNTPMAIDRADHRLFVVTRKPAKLFALDTRTGRIVASLDCSRDADDMIYDAAHKLVLVSCGQGYVNVYRQLGPNRYTLATRIASGTHAKTSLLVPSLDRYYVAAVASGGRPAQILVYRVE